MATRGLYRFSLVCSIIAFVFMFIAFATPFWYQSWRRVHSAFGNIGLWHVCLNGFIMPGDPVMKSYVGCWWIHSTEFSLIEGQLQPAWFRFIQGFSIFSVLMDLLAAVLILIFFRKTPKPNLAKNRIRIFFIASALLLGSAFLVFLIALVFAEMSNDSDWMPRPWMNYLSWSYGLCVVSGFFASFGGMSLFVLALIYKDKELYGDPELVSAAEIARKQRKLEKQDAMMRQQGGMMMDPVGPRTPHGSGMVGPRPQHGSGMVGPRSQHGSGMVGPRAPHGSGMVHRPGQYQHEPAYADRGVHQRHAHSELPPPYGSQQRLPSASQSTAGSQVSRAAESFV